MAVPTSSPIKRALVRRLRQDASVMAAISGGIHQGSAPRKATYPFITYDQVTAPTDFTWGSILIKARYDVFAWAKNTVEAENLDALIGAALHNAPLSVDGQSLLMCRRIGATPTGPTTDADGRRIYQIGATYQVWTDTQE